MNKNDKSKDSEEKYSPPEQISKSPEINKESLRTISPENGIYSRNGKIEEHREKESENHNKIIPEENTILPENGIHNNHKIEKNKEKESEDDDKITPENKSIRKLPPWPRPKPEDTEKESQFNDNNATTKKNLEISSTSPNSTEGSKNQSQTEEIKVVTKANLDRDLKGPSNKIPGPDPTAAPRNRSPNSQVPYYFRLGKKEKMKMLDSNRRCESFWRGVVRVTLEFLEFLMRNGAKRRLNPKFRKFQSIYKKIEK